MPVLVTHIDSISVAANAAKGLQGWSMSDFCRFTILRIH